MLLRRAVTAVLWPKEWSTLLELATRNLSTNLGPCSVVLGDRPFHRRWRNLGERGHIHEHSDLRFQVESVRSYARITRRKQEIPSQLDDLPPTLLKKDYEGIPLVEKTDDVVRRLLSLELASNKEKLKLKMEQLVERVRRSPSDCGSAEVQIAKLTAKIRNLQEHIQKHPKDKSNKRIMLMAIDRRKKLLKYLRRTRYDVFENVCNQLGIQYTFPPEYYRKVTRRWVAKKALCRKVFNEVKKQRAAERLKQKEVGTSATAKAGSLPNAGKEGTSV